MKYSYEEGNFKKGDILSIAIDRKVNIYLMDNINFQRYKNNMNCEYYGGVATCSTYNITVPRTGHWYIVMDLGGNAGILNYSIKVYK
ncbi:MULTISPECIES: DUF1883 domain-containing protein [unclassified Clostridium]|uniref:DUF1883 domain-containing protein n=1 Tax=unclassified Clostridium TaxID=2614128 RepID=UPI00029755AB|nr:MULTISPECIES: DUF1883 domain-containing protein [unclassified Clostridium]EKQ57295.1 MAG: hypothetical protein A370_01115 [Clostridium sp. Maddingley MBC34-26]